MRHACGRLDPSEAVLRERERSEKWRRHGHRMDGRAWIVDEAGERELSGARPTADRGLRFEHEHRSPRLRHDYCGGETVRTCSDYDRVIALTSRHWWTLARWMEHQKRSRRVRAKTRDRGVARTGPDGEHESTDLKSHIISIR